MAKAYQCQLTGRLVEGDGVKNFLVDLTPKCALLIVPQARISAKKTDQAEISPEAEADIRAALAKMPAAKKTT